MVTMGSDIRLWLQFHCVNIRAWISWFQRLRFCGRSWTGLVYNQCLKCKKRSAWTPLTFPSPPPTNTLFPTPLPNFPSLLPSPSPVPLLNPSPSNQRCNYKMFPEVLILQAPKARSRECWVPMRIGLTTRVSEGASWAPSAGSGAEPQKPTHFVAIVIKWKTC